MPPVQLVDIGYTIIHVTLSTRNSMTRNTDSQAGVRIIKLLGYIIQ